MYLPNDKNRRFVFKLLLLVRSILGVCLVCHQFDVKNYTEVWDLSGTFVFNNRTLQSPYQKKG